MKDNNALSWVMSGITLITGLAAEDVVRLILLIVGLVSACVSLAFNIYCWWKKAKEDGKITADELKEGKDILDKGIEEINKYTKGDK